MPTRKYRGYSQRIEIYTNERGEVFTSLYDSKGKQQFSGNEARELIDRFQYLHGAVSSHNGYFIP